MSCQNNNYIKIILFFKLLLVLYFTLKSIDVFSAVFQALIRLFRSKDLLPEKPTVTLSAFTGLAAQNIQGTTLHSLFGLGFGTSLQSIRQISPSVLSTYRCQLIALRVVIIDEISFVGCNMLACIDERLRQLRGINKPFGGVTVLCFGDLMQLKPVSDGNVFEPANCDPYGNIIGSR